jgi:hypothetical protein
MAKFKPEEASAEILHYLYERGGEPVLDADIAKHISAPVNITSRLLFDLRESPAAKIEMSSSANGAGSHAFIGDAIGLPERPEKYRKDTPTPTLDKTPTPTPKADPVKAAPKTKTKPEPRASKKAEEAPAKLQEVMAKRQRPVPKNEVSIVVNLDDVISAIAKRPATASSVARRLKADESEVRSYLEEAVSIGLATIMDSGLDEDGVYVLSDQHKPVAQEMVISSSNKELSPLDDVDRAIISFVGAGMSNKEVSQKASYSLGINRQEVTRRIVARTSDGLFSVSGSNKELSISVNPDVLAKLEEISTSTEEVANGVDLAEWIKQVNESLDIELPSDPSAALPMLLDYMVSVHDSSSSLRMILLNIRNQIDQHL